MERLRARPNEPFSSNRRQSVRFAVAPKVPRAHESIQELLRRGGMRLAPLRDFLCGERPNRERFEDVRMDAQHDGARQCVRHLRVQEGSRGASAINCWWFVFIPFGDVPAAVEFGRVAAAPVNTLRQQTHRCQEISVCF